MLLGADPPPTVKAPPERCLDGPVPRFAYLAALVPFRSALQALVNSSDVSAEVEAWEEVMTGATGRRGVGCAAVWRFLSRVWR